MGSEGDILGYYGHTLKEKGIKYQKEDYKRLHAVAENKSGKKTRRLHLYINIDGSACVVSPNGKKWEKGHMETHGAIDLFLKRKEQLLLT